MNIQNKNQNDISVGTLVKIKDNISKSLKSHPYWLPPEGSLGVVTEPGEWDCLVNWEHFGEWYCPTDWLEKVGVKNDK